MLTVKRKDTQTMDIKTNINYFKKNDNLKILGAVLLIVGLFMMWLGRGLISYILMSVFVPAGLIMFILGSIGRSSDEDIDKYIAEKMQGLEVDLTEDKKYRKRIIEHLPPKTFESYLFSDGVLLRKAKNNSLRSSEYKKNIVYLLSDELYIVSRRLGLVSGEVENTLVELSYNDIKNAQIIREEKTLTYKKNTHKIKTTFISINTDAGETLLPAPDDVLSDRFAEQIMKLVTEYKNTIS